MKPVIPHYKKDVLDQLLHQDGAPALLMVMHEYGEALKQTLSRAADEVERLRKENKALRKELKDFQNQF